MHVLDAKHLHCYQNMRKSHEFGSFCLPPAVSVFLHLISAVKKLMEWNTRKKAQISSVNTQEDLCVSPH